MKKKATARNTDAEKQNQLVQEVQDKQGERREEQEMKYTRESKREQVKITKAIKCEAKEEVRTA